jgi:TPR repeat protein
VELDETEAHYVMGCKLRVRGPARDADAALRCLRAASDRGHVRAMNEQGLLLAAQNKHRLAFNQFSRAARRGLPEAMVNATKCLMTGQGVAKDDAAAVAL